MDQFPGSPLWLGVVPLLAWQAAVDAGAEAVAFATDDELVVSWRAAGIVDADGTVEPRWAKAITVAADAVDGMVLAAQHGDIAFLSNVHLGADAVVVARSRALVEQVAGRAQLTSTEPVVEVSLSEEGPWPGVQRVLPPVAPFTTPAAENPPVSAEVAVDPALTPPESPETAVTLTLAGQGREPVSYYWYLDGEDLFRIDQSGWYRVQPGDVAAHVLGPAI